MEIERPAPAASDRAAPLIATKLAAPPPRAGLVPRPQLLARLAACHTTALTILSAPAGFGKTTLLAAWHAEERAAAPERSARPCAFAWLSLEPADSDPVRFWAYVLAALGRARPDLPGNLGAPLRATPPAIDSVVVALANALEARPGELVLVLDDYHTIGDLTVHRTLTALIEHCPAGLHLVIAGRADPPLPLARLRARDMLFELRAGDLRFSPAEADSFLRQTMGLDCSPGVVEALDVYTEGWPAGLQLAALWLRDHPEAAVHTLADEDRYLVEFLAEEVIQRQSPEVQRFMLDSAVLDRMCGELCDYVTAEARRADGGAAPLIARPSHTILEELERRHLFVVALDAHHAWFRYHSLFGDVLRRQLARLRGQVSVSRLHRRAAAWFAAASVDEPALLGDALRHAVAGKSYDLAADLIGPRADRLGAEGRISELIAWLAELPEEAVAARPALALRYAWVLFLHGRQDEAARWLETAEAALAEHGPPDPLTAALPDVIRAAMATTRHDDAAVLRHAERAAALLPPDEPVWSATLEIARGLAHLVRGDAREAVTALQRAADLSARTGNSYGVMISNWHLARTRLAQGRLEDAARAIRHAAAEDDRTYAGYREVGLAAVAYERDELALARDLARSGLERLEAGGGQPRVIIVAHTLLARVARALGDQAEAALQLDQGEALARLLELHEDQAELAALGAAFAVDDGDLARADDWAAACGLDAQAPDVRRESELLTLARLLAAKGRTDAALALIAPLRAAAEAQGRIRTLVRCELARAEACERAGQLTLARAALVAALQQAAARGLYRIVRDASPGVLALAEELRHDPRAADPMSPVARALAALQRPLAAAPHEAVEAHDGDRVYEPLSERELRVLGLIGAGCSNQEIAEALIVSINTIKTHIKRIYEKLQVSSRVEAVERARALGLYR